jgi:O-antigen/teichoic acid export membrane protein
VRCLLQRGEVAFVKPDHKKYLRVPSALRQLRAWRPGQLAKNTVVVTSGMGLRAVSQAVVFLVCARVLGVSGYGAVVAILTLASVLSNFSGLGGHVLLVRDVSRRPESFPESWGHTLAALLVGIGFVFPVYLLASVWLLPQNIPWSATIILGIGELIFWPLANVATYAYQGYERMGRASHMMLAPVVFRLIAALIFLAFNTWARIESPLLVWSVLYTLAMAVSALYMHLKVWKDLALPRWGRGTDFRKRIREGIIFSVWGLAEKMYVDADKLMLARLASVDATGLYSAGNRVVDFLFLPLYALLNAAAPRFFRAGYDGTQGALKYAKQVAPTTIVFGAVAGLSLFVAAPLLPIVLGDDYAPAAEITRWLCWLPLVSSPRLLLQYALATSGRHKIGMIAVAIGGGANVLLNFWLIAPFGWRGAVGATYTAEILMAAVMARSMQYISINQKRNES